MVTRHAAVLGPVVPDGPLIFILLQIVHPIDIFNELISRAGLS